MNVLVLNAGSSSQKSCLYSWDAREALPIDAPTPVWDCESEVRDDSQRTELLRKQLCSLWSGPDAILKGPGDIDVVGHRVVHGGARFRETVPVSGEVKSAIRDLCDLAPAHNPAALVGMDVIGELLGAATPQYAVFDTAFHRTLPDAAAIYPGPYSWEEQGIRRYGFHGINHQYVAGRAAHLLGQELAKLRLISCHLGSGCSLAAIAGGVSIDTTMGFTPLDGLMMGSRSGAVDPGILLYLLRRNDRTLAELDRALNRESGLKGISGLSADMREILGAAERGNTRARLALDIYVRRLRSGIGAMAASLGGVDALIFTAGVGEHAATIRSSVCESLGFLGVQLDAAKNEDIVGDCDIAATASKVRVLVIRAEEDWAIAREVFAMHHAPERSSEPGLPSPENRPM